MSRIIAAGMGVLLILAVAGCSNLNSTEQRTLTGAGIGAAGGAALGAVTGGLGIGTGALIGAGVGAAGGYIYDQTKK
jgi:hypothetical protein